jgi:ankyrin repeat protein
MLAASNNHAEVVELLLQRGAKVDQQERTQGWTALIWAAKQGHQASVAALRRHGADPGIRDGRGRTAADWASEAGHPEVLALIAAPPH